MTDPADLDVRTPAVTERPMAFTAEQFVHGELVAYGWFLLLHSATALAAAGALWAIEAVGGGGPAGEGPAPGLLSWALSPIVAVLVAVFAGVAVLVGALPAALLGLALRSVRRRSIHLLAFALLGGALAFLATALLLPGAPWPVHWWYAAIGAVAVALGRRAAMRSRR